MKTEGSGDGVSARSRQPRTQLELDCDWDDLVLDDEQLELLRSVCAEIRRRHRASGGGTRRRTNGRSSGLRVLLDGEPGTGKTLAARVIGAEVGLDVVCVDLARVAEQEPANVERSLQRVLASSAKSGAITVFDGPEAMFGKRPARSRRRKPGIDVTRLLAALDAHPGPVLFASSLKPRIDAELTRRLDFVIDLPFPDAESRQRIWRLLLPADARLRGQDLEFISTSFKLPGGAIRDCCAAAETAAATRRAPVDLGHIARALKGEYSNRLLSSSTQEAIDEIRRRQRTEGPAPRLAASVPPPQVTASEPPLTGGGQTATKATPGPAAPNPPGRRVVLIAVGAAVVAGLVGLLVAGAVTGSDAPPPLNSHAVAGPLRVSFPTDWKQQAPPPPPQFGLTDEVALAPPSTTRGRVLIGHATTANASLLPQSLLAALPSQPKPQVVSLDGAQYYRYLDLAPQGTSGPISVYALPTTAGTVIGVCLKSGAAASFAGECERVLGTVRPTAGSVLALGPSASYAAGLNAAISALNSVRTTPDPQLRSARTPAAQATAANELAAAHKTAAATVSGLSAGPAESANLTLAGALTSTAHAYAALGAAATSGDVQGYATAGASLTRAQSALAAAFAQLSQLGYATS
jgi:ATPase family associated with various cellular activities (AAA)